MGEFFASGKPLSPVLCAKCRSDTFKIFATTYTDTMIDDFIMKCAGCGQMLFDEDENKK